MCFQWDWTQNRVHVLIFFSKSWNWIIIIIVIEEAWVFIKGLFRKMEFTVIAFKWIVWAKSFSLIDIVLSILHLLCWLVWRKSVCTFIFFIIGRILLLVIAVTILLQSMVLLVQLERLELGQSVGGWSLLVLMEQVHLANQVVTCGLVMIREDKRLKSVEVSSGLLYGYTEVL